MHWYPFDKQVCNMEFSAPEELDKFVNLSINGHKNLGPSELTQYFIMNIEMFQANTEDGRQRVILSVTLGRRLLASVLTVFIPTILLNIIGHSTNYFKAFYGNFMKVNLTVMLVLTTFFVNVSNKLPTTSYIKMIDIWLIFNLVIPFVEVIVHTYKVIHTPQFIVMLVEFFRIA